MGHDICAELDRTAVDRRGEGIVHDQRHAVAVRQTGKFFNIKHRNGGIGDGLAEHGARVGAERLGELFLGSVLIDKGDVDAHLLHGHAEQVVGAAVDRGGCHDVAAGLTDVEQCEEVGCLSAGGEHRRYAAFERRELCRYEVIGRVLQTGVKIAGCLQIEQLAHIVAGGVFPGRALIDRELSRLAVLRLVARMQTFGFYIHFILLLWNGFT